MKLELDVVQSVQIILSFITVVFSYLTVKYTLKSLTETLRPYVNYSVEVEGNIIFLVIKNTGKRAAYNIKAKFNRNFTSYSAKELNMSEGFDIFFENTKCNIPFLQANTCSKIEVDSISSRRKYLYKEDFKSNKYEDKYTIDISYNDIKKKNYKDTYEIDIFSLMHFIRTTPQIEKKIEDIEKKLSYMVRALNNIGEKIDR